MSDASDKSEELKTLQREAAELQESRKRANSEEVKGSEEPPVDMTEKGPIKETVDSEAAVAVDDENHDVAGQLEAYLNELEEVALERPVLALLVTFSLGVIVGHLFSRK